MKSDLVWDNKTRILSLPTHAPHQFTGSALDNLAELGGRICYDSCNKEGTRPSKEYHAHIRQVRHLSIYEHCTFTVKLPLDDVDPWQLLNRPCLYARRDRGIVRLTLNLRHCLEWNDSSLGDLLRATAASQAPLTIQSPPRCLPLPVALPETPHEHWLSFLISGVSRSLTHELVRHGDWTAISQRSTRYCDESATPWAWHPLRNDLDIQLFNTTTEHSQSSRRLYTALVEDLISKGHSRKSARGAARGVLGNALSTQLLFSASLAQWSHILNMRHSLDADEEIYTLASTIKRTIQDAGYEV